MGSYLVVKLLGGRVLGLWLIAGLEHYELTHVAQVAVTNKENLKKKLCRLWRGPRETSCLSLVGRCV